jgi:hypothetical protein
MRNELYLAGKVALERLSGHVTSVKKRQFHEMTSRHNGLEGGCGRQTGVLGPADRLSSWAERLARNARGGSTPGVAITLFGVPGGFAAFLGFSTV